MGFLIECDLNTYPWEAVHVDVGGFTDVESAHGAQKGLQVWWSFTSAIDKLVHHVFIHRFKPLCEVWPRSESLHLVLLEQTHEFNI